MDFSLPYFIYCENALGFLPQPFNVLSCFVYLGVGFWLWVKGATTQNEFSYTVAVLVILHGLCGIYWHAANVPLGLVFDIVSALLLTAFLAVALCQKLLRWPLWACLLAVVGMIVLSTLLKDAGIPYLTQNGGAFLPPLFLLAFVALKVQAENQSATIYTLSAAYLLFIGVIFRSADMAVCQHFSLGTHFLSHLCAAGAVFYVIRAIDAMEEGEPEVVEKKEPPKNILESDLL
jgi:hypothetical protein